MTETVKIYTADDLKNFRDRVNNGNRALNAVLMADINIAEKDEKGRYVSWVPIGNGFSLNDYTIYNEADPYIGVFDGKGHSISGLHIINKNTHTHGPQPIDTVNEKYRLYDNICGLFCSNAGTIKNLTVDGYIKNYTGEVSAGICGENVSGGIIDNCINKCTVIDCSASGGYTGGIAGETYWKSSIKNCINEGKIIGCGYGTSGIVGNYAPREMPFLSGDWNKFESMDKCQISGCINYGDIYITQGIQDMSLLKANNYRYNQIFDTLSTDHVTSGGERINGQYGKVIFPFRNTLIGMYLRYAYIFIGYYPSFDKKILQGNYFSFYKRYLNDLKKLLRNDPNPEYVNELGQTYLHLLCGFHRDGVPYDWVLLCLQNKYDKEDPPLHLIKLLAKETKIDFSAKDKNGMTAVDYLKKHEVSPHTQEAIDLIESIIKKQNA